MPRRRVRPVTPPRTYAVGDLVVWTTPRRWQFLGTHLPARVAHVHDGTRGIRAGLIDLNVPALRSRWEFVDPSALHPMAVPV